MQSKSKPTHLFPYDWTLKDAVFEKDKGKVFSCFSGGGGSTMGYKLAGFDVLGCNEIDPRMMKIYEANHKPKYSFLESIVDFKNRKDLPDELFDLDILDGSPPCSSFSVTGDRDKSWGKEKKFREGQKKQVLDTLFFDFIDLAKRLQPKVVVAENVEGILIGKAKYVFIRILKELKKAGYFVIYKVLDGSKMGLPQRRKRVFVVALRNDLCKPFMKKVNLLEYEPFIDLNFSEQEIPFMNIIEDDYCEMKPTQKLKKLWDNREFGDRTMESANNRVFGKNGFFSQSYIYRHEATPTLTSKRDSLVLFDYPRFLNKNEVCKISSFPTNFDFCGGVPHYTCGMSVPPIMIAQIASRIYDFWLSKI